MRITNLSILIVFTIITFSASASAQPANDMWASATTISGIEPFSSTNSQSNVGATLEAGEPDSCAGCATVWYKWTAPISLSVTFNTSSGTLGDTVLGVYKGTAANSMSMVTWNDDSSYPAASSRVTFIADAGEIYYLRVYGNHGDTGTFSLWWGVNNAESSGQFNFAFSGQIMAPPVFKSEFAIFRPSGGQWWTLAYSPWGQQTPYASAIPWGFSTDKLAPGDYDGDSYTDIAIWRPEDGTYWIRNSHDGSVTIRQWGIAGDEPVQGDFDGDDKADIAVWRSSTGQLWVLRSSDETPYVFGFGSGECCVAPAVGDYDGDGKTDFAFKVGSGIYVFDEIIVLRSSDGQTVEYPLGYYGVVPGDYDGDGKNDPAVYVDGSGSTPPGFIYIRSSDGQQFYVPFGLRGDYPLPGDYFPPNDSRTVSDLCVWRPSDGYLYCLADGGSGILYTRSFGMAGDVPVAISNVH